MVYSQIWSSGPIPCGRTGCPNLVVDRQQAVFIITGGMTFSFCCPACFSTACERQIRQYQIQAAKDPLERLGYVSNDAG